MKKFIYDIRFAGSIIVEADSEKEALHLAEQAIGPAASEVDILEVVHEEPNSPTDKL